MNSSSPPPSSQTTGAEEANTLAAPTVPPAAANPDALTISPPASWPGGLPAQLPAVFGRYQLLRLLGKGGMGAVYLAHDTQLDRPVALKIPLFSVHDSADLKERFFREAR